MSDIKWIKLNVAMFEDEKIRLIEAMPDADSLVNIWIKLLIQAGKTNASGYIFMSQNIPYSDEMLATLFRKPVNTIRFALQTFHQFGMIEVDDRGFILIENWEKHQSIDAMEKIRLQQNLRKKKQRTKNKLLELGYDSEKADEIATKQVYEEQNKDKNNQCHVTSNVTVTLSHAIEEEIEEEEEEELEKELVSSSSSNAYAFFQQNFGVMSPFVAEEIEYWIKDLNEVCVIEAMKRALRQSKKWNYAQGILKEWIDNNVSTLADIEAREAEFVRNKNRKGVKTSETDRRNNQKVNDETRSRSRKSAMERIAEEVRASGREIQDIDCEF